MITTDHIRAASELIGPSIIRTPLFVSAPMSERAGATILVKAEHTQHTGSFKLRGALNAVLGSVHGERNTRGRAAGVVTASSGNHGVAVATAAELASTDCTVYLPTGASPSKVAAIAALGAEIVTVDSTDAYQAEVDARAAAETGGSTYISPYNDRSVIAGQGTVGLEIAEDAGVVDAVVVAVGGGGLISGIATWMAEHSPSTKIIGASPANDAAMFASIEAGRVVDGRNDPTFSDGTAGGIEPDAITFDLCRTLVADWMLVSEAEIAKAVAAMIDDHHQLVEGAAGVALAATHRYGLDHPGSTVVVVSCGANVSSARLAEMLALRPDGSA